MKFYATWTKFTKKCKSVVVVMNAKEHYGNNQIIWTISRFIRKSLMIFVCVLMNRLDPAFKFYKLH